MSTEEEGEGFLARWSRRKRAAEQEPPEAPPTDPPADAQPEPPAPVRAACPIPNLPPIDLDALPRIEELTAQSDFSLFLRPGIPQALRNAALRRMWSLDPAIRDYIGPVEYQWDFNAPGGLPAGFSADLAGDVGRLLAQAIGRLDDLTGPEREAPPPPDIAPPGPPPPALAEPPSAPEAPAADLPPPEPAVVAAPPRRRHGGALPA